MVGPADVLLALEGMVRARVAMASVDAEVRGGVGRGGSA